ncbi:hypothetical protein IPL68_07970 [Candidatus Saccharibacteria bacterium]|nr:MAG: hypothetical protein IPL68_07970 [Candidatus Saccharibacteria bacterium]
MSFWRTVFYKAAKKQQTPQAVMTPVITPTNPDPDAVIPAHIAEKEHRSKRLPKKRPKMERYQGSY